MSILIEYDDVCRANISGSSDLTELSFSVESAINYLIGRCATGFECYREKKGENCLLTISPLGPVKEMSYSPSAQTSVVFTKELDDKFIGFKEDSSVKFGSSKLVKTKDSNVSIIAMDFNGKMPIYFLTYGLSDMIVGLFAMGSNYVKWHACSCKSEILIRHKISHDNLLDFFKSKKPDYDVKRLVSTLS